MASFALVILFICTIIIATESAKLQDIKAKQIEVIRQKRQLYQPRRDSNQGWWDGRNGQWPPSNRYDGRNFPDSGKNNQPSGGNNNQPGGGSSNNDNNRPWDGWRDGSGGWDGADRNSWNRWNDGGSGWDNRHEQWGPNSAMYPPPGCYCGPPPYNSGGRYWPPHNSYDGSRYPEPNDYYGPYGPHNPSYSGGNYGPYPYGNGNYEPPYGPNSNFRPPYGSNTGPFNRPDSGHNKHGDSNSNNPSNTGTDGGKQNPTPANNAAPARSP